MKITNMDTYNPAYPYPIREVGGEAERDSCLTSILPLTVSLLTLPARHFGLNNYFLVGGGTALSFAGSLAASLVSAYQRSIASLPHQLMNLKKSPDIGKCALGVKLPPLLRITTLYNKLLRG